MGSRFWKEETQRHRDDRRIGTSMQREAVSMRLQQLQTRWRVRARLKLQQKMRLSWWFIALCVCVFL